MPEVRGGYIKASYVASGNLSQWRLVMYSGVNVYTANASGGVTLGVTQNHPNDNEEATLVTLGHTKVTLGGSLASGARFMANNTGFAIQATSGQWVPGFLVTGADSGGIAEAILAPHVTGTAV